MIFMIFWKTEGLLKVEIIYCWICIVQIHVYHLRTFLLLSNKTNILVQNKEIYLLFLCWSLLCKNQIKQKYLKGQIYITLVIKYSTINI